MGSGHRESDVEQVVVVGALPDEGGQEEEDDHCTSTVPPVFTGEFTGFSFDLTGSHGGASLLPIQYPSRTKIHPFRDGSPYL